ncbi:hypothetical protein [Veronia nyctiphanis]|uniref:hypothetical protein n=1 Tax=Veronia nyctiphanis TaxID=1278244 RepID=UPI0013759E9F|nr:hypothetical protein [Veronia nyctiphanis]
MAKMMAFDRLGRFDDAYYHAVRLNDIAPSEQSRHWVAYLKRKTEEQSPLLYK